jgi:hypothetical protein
MSDQIKIKASQLLQLKVENSILKQQILFLTTAREIDDEAKSLQIDPVGFDMDDYSFILKNPNPEVKE